MLNVPVWTCAYRVCYKFRVSSKMIILSNNMMRGNQKRCLIGSIFALLNVNTTLLLATFLHLKSQRIFPYSESHSFPFKQSHRYYHVISDSLYDAPLAPPLRCHLTLSLRVSVTSVPAFLMSHDWAELSGKNHPLQAH